MKSERPGQRVFLGSLPVAAVGIAAMLPQAANAQSIPPFTQYLVTDIANLRFIPNPDAIGSMGMNHLGVVYAYQLPVPNGTNGDGTYRPFVWLASNAYGLGQGFHEIVSPVGPSGFSLPAIGRAINTSGLIAGQSGSVTDGTGVATVWTLGPTVSVNTLGSLGALSGDIAWSSAYDINQNSSPNTAVAGNSSMVGDCTCNVFGEHTQTRGFTALFAGANNPTLTPLPMPSGGGSSFAYAVNTPFGDPLTFRSGGAGTCIDSMTNLPNCLGFPSICDPQLKGMEWQNTALLTVLPDLSTQAGAVVRAVNSSGISAGYAFVPSTTICQPKAGVWSPPSPTSVFTALPVPTNHNSRAEGMNNQALPTVVGWDEDTLRGVAWTQQSGGTWTMTDLTNALPPLYSQWLVVQAHDVNNSGWIAAWAQLSGTTENHAILLTPIPTCHADITGDGEVDIDDLLAVILQYGPCQPGIICSADTDVNGFVNIDDLLAVINGWGPACSGLPADDVPRTVQDCLSRYGSDPQRCAKCLEAIQLLENQ